jgi:hypothetical protein
MTKKERKKYGMLPPKIVESDIISLGHGLCGSGGFIPFTIRTPGKTHSLLALTMIDAASNTGLLKCCLSSEQILRPMMIKSRST